MYTFGLGKNNYAFGLGTTGGIVAESWRHIVQFSLKIVRLISWRLEQ